MRKLLRNNLLVVREIAKRGRESVPGFRKRRIRRRL